ncbi:MAG: acetyltransferase [bacterium]|nr:acetyltransferase [bacterium]
MKKIILIGGGEHCRVILSVFSRSRKKLYPGFHIHGIIDRPENVGKKISGVKIIGTDKDLGKLRNKVDYALISIGATGNNTSRRKLYQHVKKIGYQFFILRSVNAIIDESTEIGEGSVIMPGVVINCGTCIGKNVIINTGAVIDHDCRIGDHVHIAPGVTLSGGVSVEADTHIGTGASVIQHVQIGKNCLIGAGSVVVNNVPANVVAYGNPCRQVRKNG